MAAAVMRHQRGALGCWLLSQGRRTSETKSVDRATLPVGHGRLRQQQGIEHPFNSTQSISNLSCHAPSAPSARPARLIDPHLQDCISRSPRKQLRVLGHDIELVKMSLAPAPARATTVLPDLREPREHDHEPGQALDQQVEPGGVAGVLEQRQAEADQLAESQAR